MNTYTPGPWETSKHGTPAYAPQYGVYAENDSNDIAIVCNENAEANARLMAAAPELLAALQSLLNECEQYRGFDSGAGLLVDARAAIRKAKGE